MAVSSFFFSFTKKISFINFYSCSLILGILHISMFIFPTLQFFHLLNFFIGVFFGLFLPICYQKLKEDRDSDSISHVGYLNIIIGIGLALGQYISGFFGGFKFIDGWKIAYLLVGLLMITSSAISLAFSDFSGRIKSSNVWKHKFQLKSKFYKYLLIQYIPGSIPWGAINVFFFHYVQSSTTLTKIDSINIIIFIGIGMVLGAFFASIILDKVSSDKMIFYIIQISFILSQFFCIIIFYYLEKLEILYIFLLVFFSGIVLAFPGIYIKGILFKYLDSEETKFIFSFENFLESLGKGLGPLIIGWIIFQTENLFISLLFSTLFWNLSMLFIFLAFRYSPQNEI